MPIGEVKKSIPLRIKVYNMLKEAIIQGELEQGERIVESKLAEELEISRTPVREALRLLESEGYLTSHSSGGLKVTEVTEEDVKNWSEIKVLLDQLAVKKAIENITAEQLQDLEDILADAEKKMEEGEYKKSDIVSVGSKFHKKLFEASNNKLLISISRDYQKFTLRLRKHIAEIRGREKEAFKEHKKILEEIKAGNEEKAVKLIKEHSKNAREELLEKFKD